VWGSGLSGTQTSLLYYKIMLNLFSVVPGCRSGGQCGHTPGGHPHLDPAGRGGHGGPDPLRCTLWVRAAATRGSGTGIRHPLRFFYPWIHDPGWVKNQDPDPG
jgi:hypothetical protein